MIENVLKWGKVVGQFVGVRGDDMGDEDENPEIVPMQGRVTFTPRAKHTLASNTPAGPLTVFMSEPITAELNDEGELTRNGAIGVKLPASDSAVSPNGFTYEVKFDLTFEGKPVQYAAFSILVPAASEAEPIDLTMVTPVRTESGKPITQGVGVQSMQIVGSAFVIQYTNGSVQNAPITGPIADSAAISQLRAETTANTEVVRALAPALRPVIFTVAKEIAANSPDARADLQAALNAAANGDDASYWAFLRFYAGTVHVAPGVYRISAPADGQPSIVVPRGVNLDFSDATLVFEYPSNMTTLWCGILQHSQAGVRVGNMVTKGAAPSNAHVYDALRIYHGDNGQQVHGVPGSTISNFQGAAVRGLGTYVTRMQDIRVSFCSHGLVHGHSSGLVTDGVAPYALPAGSSGQASGAARRPTDMWVQNVIFDSTKGDVIVVGAVGSADKPNEVQGDADQITGGNLYLEHVLIEGTPARAVVARELSQIVLDDVHLEEVGAPGGAMFDIDVVYGNIVAGPLRINITGQRDVTNLSGVTTRATPLGIFQVGGFQSFKCHDVYLRNDLGELWFSGPEPWVGAWGEVSIERVVLDKGSTGTLSDGGLISRGNGEAGEAARGWPTNGADITDRIREELEKFNGGPGVVRIPEGEFFLGGGASGAGTGIRLESGQRIEGAGRNQVTNSRTVLYTTDASKGMAQIIRSDHTTGAAVTGLTFENRCTSLEDVSFRDPVYFRSCSDYEISVNTSTPNGVGFQFDLNLKADEGTGPENWGFGGWVHDCYFTALTEFHQSPGIRVERCHWEIDRALKRPLWLRGATQTAFKVSGGSHWVSDTEINDCSLHMFGTGERLEPFELFRTQDVKVSRLTYRGDRPDFASLISSETTKTIFSPIEGVNNVEFRDCSFGNMNVALSENVDFRAVGCEWNNTTGTNAPWNAISDAYDPTKQQASTVHPNQVHLENCRFKGGGRYLAALRNGLGMYRIINCSMEYINTVYSLGINITGSNKRVEIDGLHIEAHTPGAAVYLSAVGFASIDGVTVTTPTGFTLPRSPVYVAGVSGEVRVGSVHTPVPVPAAVIRETSFTGRYSERERGILLKSPDGNTWLVAVSNTGTIAATSI